jgi:hypothetical protein
MSKRRNQYLLMVLPAVTLIVCVVCLAASETDQATPVGRPARIQPDYADTVIPPNIAPLNFIVREGGLQYRVRIAAGQGGPIEIDSRSPKIVIPGKPWRRLLAANRGREFAVEVCVRMEDEWRRFDAFRVTVANEEIDGYLAYRRIHPAHSAWRDMGIYQRDLRTFKESSILTNDYFRGGCVNCHTFCNNRTDTMLVSTRSTDYGNSAVIVRDGKVEKVGSTFGYASWHPSGKILVYTSMKVAMFLHPGSEEVRDVIDLDSLLAYYDAEARKVRTAPDLARKDRLETYPTWSPDGRYLYFCSAPLTWTNRSAIPEQYDRIKYDLMRIPYDADQGTWGPAETVLAAQETGRSILLPRISPDGRWLLLSMCDYGCFPAYRKSSDLYMIDLEAARQTGRHEPRRLEINSDQSESWHSWSSNSRWIAFSSKRDNGLFTRTYLAYVDPTGVVHKPLVLPQKDPTHYDSCLWTYSVPELVTEPVRTTKEALGRVVRSSRKISIEMPVTMATPKADTTPSSGAPYQSGRE